MCTVLQGLHCPEVMEEGECSVFWAEPRLLIAQKRERRESLFLFPPHRGKAR